jgi:hypothetical protein
MERYEEWISDENTYYHWEIYRFAFLSVNLIYEKKNYALDQQFSA